MNFEIGKAYINDSKDIIIIISNSKMLKLYSDEYGYFRNYNELSYILELLGRNCILL